MAAANGTDGLKHFAMGHCGVIITDVRMLGPDGWEVARRVSAASPEVGIIVMSGLDPSELRAAGGRRLTTLAKPFTLEELLAAITRVTTIPVAA